MWSRPARPVRRFQKHAFRRTGTAAQDLVPRRRSARWPRSGAGPCAPSSPCRCRAGVSAKWRGRCSGVRTGQKWVTLVMLYAGSWTNYGDTTSYKYSMIGKCFITKINAVSIPVRVSLFVKGVPGNCAHKEASEQPPNRRNGRFLFVRTRPVAIYMISQGERVRNDIYKLKSLRFKTCFKDFEK